MTTETNLPQQPPHFYDNTQRILALQSELASHLSTLEGCSGGARDIYSRIMELAGRYLGDYGVAWAVARCNVPVALATQGASALTKVLASMEKKHHMAKLLKIKQKTASESLPALNDLCLRIDREVGLMWPATELNIRKRYPIDEGISESVAQLRSEVNGLRLGLYLQAVAGWVRGQYRAWLEGKHDSGVPCPTPGHTTGAIVQQWYGNSLRPIFERAVCPGKTTIAGLDLLLLTDPQLSIMAVQQECADPVKVNPEKFNPLITRHVLPLNERLQRHATLVERYQKAIEQDPLRGQVWIIIALAAAVMAGIWLLGSWAVWGRITATLLCLASAWRLWRLRRIRLICDHVDRVHALAAEISSLRNG